MKILLAATGGTIGSVYNKNEISVALNGGELLLKKYKEHHSTDNISFTVTTPINLLSENMTYSSMNTFCSFLLNINYREYDGIIITHGSDTLAYASSLAGMLLSCVSVPVVLTAADYPLDNPKSNGISNFNDALCFIRQKIPGVFVSYGKSIYISTRLTSANPYTDAFAPFDAAPFAAVQNGKIIVNSCANNISQQPAAKCGKKLISNINFTKNILLLTAHPNLDYSAVNITDNTAAVLQYQYHSGTGCTVGDTTNFLSFAQKCRTKNLPVYIASCKKKQSDYTTALAIKSVKGVCTLYNITMESAYIKLCLAYNQTEQPPKEFMKTNIFYEHIY